jgi:hypothetical protein
MSAYPSAIYSPRERANWPKVVFNPLNKTSWFKEDADAIENEVIAIENALGLNLENVLFPPGGNNTEIQYNKNGIFGGASGLTFNATTKDVALTAGFICGVFKPAVDSTSAFQFKNAAGTDYIFNINTVDKRISIGGLGGGGTYGERLFIAALADKNCIRLDASADVTAQAFVINHNLPTDTLTGRCFTFDIVGENFSRGVFYSNGAYGIGPGGNLTRDVFIGRSGAGIFRIGTTIIGADISGHTDSELLRVKFFSSGSSPNFYTILKSADSLAADLIFTLPNALPPATKILNMSTTGEMGFDANVYFTNTSKIASTVQAVALVLGDTKFTVTRNVATVTTNALSNSITKIEGGISGMTLSLIFKSANVTMVDNALHGADTMQLKGNIVSAPDTTLTLVSDGTSWYEITRSAN